MDYNPTAPARASNISGVWHRNGQFDCVFSWLGEFRKIGIPAKCQCIPESPCENKPCPRSLWRSCGKPAQSCGTDRRTYLISPGVSRGHSRGHLWLQNAERFLQLSQWALSSWAARKVQDDGSSIGFLHEILEFLTSWDMTRQSIVQAGLQRPPTRTFRWN